MTVYSPIITYPLSKSSNPKYLTFEFSDSNPGVTLASYSLRRRQMYPAVGAYEYWNGSAYGAVETFVDVPSGTIVRNGGSLTLSGSTVGTVGTKYQFAVAVKDSRGDVSPYSTDILAQFYSVFIAQIDTVALMAQTGVTRPMISWIVTGATYRIKEYRVLIMQGSWSQGTLPIDPDDPPAPPVWDSGWVTDPGQWYTYPDVDLTSGLPYRMYVGVRDENGVSSEWFYMAAFTPSASIPPAPSLSLTPNALLGRMEMTLTTTAWSPSGYLDQLFYVVERSEDNGITWEAVWGASRSNAADASGGTAQIVDRAAAFSRDDVKYRAFAMGFTTAGLPVNSVAAVVTAPAILGTTNWLRSPYHPEFDLPVRLESISQTIDTGSEVYDPVSSDYSIVTYNAQSFGREAQLSVRTDNRAVFDILMGMLRSRETVYFQGHLPGQKWWGRVIGQPQFDQVRATALPGELSSVRHLFKVSFKLHEVAPEEATLSVRWDSSSNAILNLAMQEYMSSGYVAEIITPPTMPSGSEEYASSAGSPPAPPPGPTDPLTRTVDVSSDRIPAATTGVHVGSVTRTIIPDEDSLVVALVGLANGTSGQPTCTVTDSLGSTWTCVGRSEASAYLASEIWAMDAGVAPVSRTVTVTGTDGTGGIFLQVLSVRGAQHLAEQKASPRFGYAITKDIRTTTDDSLVVSVCAGSSDTSNLAAATGNTLLAHGEADTYRFAAAYVTQEPKANGRYTSGFSNDGSGSQYCTHWEIIPSTATLPFCPDIFSAGMEAGTTGDWGDLTAGDAVSSSTVKVHAGKRSLRYVAAATGHKLYLPSPVASDGFSVSPGGLVRVGGWFATESASLLTFRAGVDHRTSAHASISTASGSGSMVASSGWQFISGVPSVVPLTGAYVNPYLQFDTIGTYYFDDLIYDYIPPMIYLTMAPADIEVTSGTDTKRMASFTAPLGVSSFSNVNSVAGSTTGVQFTDSEIAGVNGLPISWYTPPLEGAVWPSGGSGNYIGYRYRARQSDMAANMAAVFDIDLVQGDGTWVQNIVNHTMSQITGELSTTAGGLAAASRLTNSVSVTIPAGYRLRFRAYADDAADHSGAGAMAAGYNAQLWYGGSDNLGVAFSFEAGLAAA